MRRTSDINRIHINTIKRKPARVAARIAGTLTLIVFGASADAPPGPYFNGFETDTAGWFNYSGATITRVASGSSSTYANGVAAAPGNYYARLGKDPSPPTCASGGGPQPWSVGP